MKPPHKPSKHRLWLVRRITELPLLLQQREFSQTELRRLYDVDAVTIRRDIRALSDYWPVERFFREREVYYRIAPDARPKLKQVGVKRN